MQKIFGTKPSSSKYCVALQSIYHANCCPRKALILGAGFVVKPTLTHLCENGVHVTVGRPSDEVARVITC